MKLLSYAEEPFIVRPNKTDDCWDVSIVDALIYAFIRLYHYIKMRFLDSYFVFNGVAAVTAIDFGALWRFTCFANTNISVSSHYRNQFIFYSVRKFSLPRFFSYFSIFVSLSIKKKKIFEHCLVISGKFVQFQLTFLSKEEIQTFFFHPAIIVHASLQHSYRKNWTIAMWTTWYGMVWYSIVWYGMVTTAIGKKITTHEKCHSWYLTDQSLTMWINMPMWTFFDLIAVSLFCW